MHQPLPPPRSSPTNDATTPILYTHPRDRGHRGYRSALDGVDEHPVRAQCWANQRGVRDGATKTANGGALSRCCPDPRRRNHSAEGEEPHNDPSS